MKKLVIFFITIMLAVFSTTFANSELRTDKQYNLEKEKMLYTMPAEDFMHEGTWITWPHQYTYGIEYRNEIENIWIQMAQALQTSEKVHIIAYNQTEQIRIEKLLIANKIDMQQIDFVIAKSDDVWIRDTGPIFVFDENNQIVIANFVFDGWGGKTEFMNDDQIPLAVGIQKKIEVIDIPNFVLEGGAIEIDGKGTLMANLSSVLSKNRNQKLTIEQVESYLSQYLGVNNFIWLKGVIDEDITDAHIDGTARFINEHSILTVSEADFLNLYENIDINDYHILKNAKNAKGEPYKIITLPLTKKNIPNLDYQASYLNYYIANKVVLVPIYNDENDSIALEIIKDLYPKKEIIPIDLRALFQYGGMIHCVTQQQPKATL